MRRELAALGRPPFTPTEEQRSLVRILVFNETPEHRIAEVLHLDLLELRYHFHRELNYSRDQLLAIAAQTVVDLAAQRDDLPVALRATELMLKTHSPAWREPKQTEAPPPVLDRIESLTLDEVQRELARLRGDRPADPGAAPADPEGVAD